MYFLLLFLISPIMAFDLRTKTCHEGTITWQCWFNQTCSSELYQCAGEATDSPLVSVIGFYLIIVVAAVILSVGLTCCLYCIIKRTFCPCC